MCPHIPLNSLHPHGPSSLYCSFNHVFLLSTVFLLPFPHAALALLQRCAAKPWAAVAGLEMGLGAGDTQDLPGGVVALCLLSLVREQGFPCLNLSGQGTKQKEGAELYNEPIRGGVVCRTGCVYNREKTLLGGVFNL